MLSSEVLFFYLAFIISLLENVYSRPPIFSEDIQSSFNTKCNISFNISCSGDYPITWTYFPIYDNKNNVIIEYFENSKNDRKFSAMLKIVNTSYKDVNHYYCHYLDADITDTSSSIKFYLYINDICDKKLSVIDRKEYKVNLVQYKTGYLPCRPTAPDVHVDLYMNDFRIIEKKTLLWKDYGIIEGFDRRYGWTVKDIYKANVDPITLKCVFIHRNDNNRNYTLTLKIHVVEKDINKNELTLKQVSQCNITKVFCNVNIPGDYSFHWIKPYNIKDKLIKEDTNILTMKTSSKYEGNYTCMVFNYITLTSAKKTITVNNLDAQQSIIKFYNCSNAINNGIISDNITFDVILSSNDINSNIIAKWFKNNQEITSTNYPHYIFKRKHNIGSIHLSFTINNLNYSDSGNYSIDLVNIGERKEFYLNIFDGKPVINSNSLSNKMLVLTSGTYIRLECYIANNINIIPYRLSWYKNGKKFDPLEYKWMKIVKNIGEIIETFQSMENDTGKYECKIENKYGEDKKYIDLKISSPKLTQTTYVLIYGIIIFIIIIAFIVVIVVLIIKYKTKMIYKKTLKLIELENFKKGTPESLNYDLGIAEQADLLPYNEKYEFPQNKLKLIKRIGNGQFGVVIKATAYGIIKGTEKTTVAVKMVKNRNREELATLMSELKIMTHLGEHINIVNLLGACTKNIKYGELIMIVEYCKYGDLQNFLQKYRSKFVNQLDQDLNFDFNIRKTIHSDLHGSVSYDNLDKTILDTRINKPNEEVIFKQFNENRCFIYSEDLVNWSYQISCGMKYLSSRKILHGDLALRNMLLAENNIVKICDFGLSKNIYKNKTYTKIENGLFPLRWLAIECIQDRVFSTQSDVWAFGIVLWELFSLGNIPYPNMNADETLFYKLINGYRMERPPFASTEIYIIMKHCWHQDPLERPSFHSLSKILASLIDSAVKNELNNLQDHNLKESVSEEQDYLSKFSSPDFKNLVSSHR